MHEVIRRQTSFKIKDKKILAFDKNNEVILLNGDLDRISERSNKTKEEILKNCSNRI